MDNYNESQLRERLYRQIADYRRLGNTESSEENFNFRSFGGKSADSPLINTNFPLPVYHFLLSKVCCSYVIFLFKYFSMVLLL